MSRSGYSDDFDGWASIRWRGAVASATLARYTVYPVLRLLPSKCPACGKRRGHCADCDGIPF